MKSSRFSEAQKAFLLNQGKDGIPVAEICRTRVRYGYRRVPVLLRRDGWQLNCKKTCRVYRELACCRKDAQRPPTILTGRGTAPSQLLRP